MSDETVCYEKQCTKVESSIVENGCPGDGLTNGDSYPGEPVRTNGEHSETRAMRLNQAEDTDTISQSGTGVIVKENHENTRDVPEKVNSDTVAQQDVNMNSDEVESLNSSVLSSGATSDTSSPDINHISPGGDAHQAPTTMGPPVINHQQQYQITTSPAGDIRVEGHHDMTPVATTSMPEGHNMGHIQVGGATGMPSPPITPLLPQIVQLNSTGQACHVTGMRRTNLHTAGNIPPTAMSPPHTNPNAPPMTTQTPPPSGTSTPSPNTCPQQGNGSQQPAAHQHVVHVHITLGETFTVRVDDQLQHIQGPATVRMVSNNGPPLPMPMQVPPGHMVQQIVDENGILTHVILSQQPHGLLGNPGGMTAGPNNAPQYYPAYGSHHYSTHPQYPSPHHHTHHAGGGGGGPAPGNTGPSTGPRGGGGGNQHMPRTQHGTPPPTSNSHPPVHSQGPSPPSNSMDDRANKQKLRMQKKHANRENEGYYRERATQRKPRKHLNNSSAENKNGLSAYRESSSGTNGVDTLHSSSINTVAAAAPHVSPEDLVEAEEEQRELEEERRAIQSHLSTMPAPKVTDIESRSALIQLSPPELDSKEYIISPAEFNYELLLCEKSRDGKYKLVYSGDATEITLKDLKPATDYFLKVCTILDDMRGTPTEAISFRTIQCEPEQPQAPKLQQKNKTSLSLKWNAPCENGSKISAYALESETGDGTGSYVEVYTGLQKQYRIAKLTASTKYTFRLAAINNSGKSEYSDPVTFCTSGSAPSQPDPPMLSERYVTDLVISWIKRPNDDEFLLQIDDQHSGHGFMPVYNGPLLSNRISHLRKNAEYKFRLAAKNDEGTSKWSDIASYRTLPAKPDPPGKPQIKGKVHAHMFRVCWDPPRDDGGSEITKYIVELDDGKGYETMYEGSEREHTCDRLQPGHTYRVRVAAVSAGGRSDMSEVCVATTQAVPPGQCSAPKLQGKPKATLLHLRWAYPDYNGGAQVNEFAVQMILPDNTSKEVYKGRDLDCIVAGLSPGRPYLFQVRAINRTGGGPWSEPLEVVSGAGVPDPPKMPVCSCRSAHSALVTWEGPVNNGATITDYRLEWQLKADQVFSQLYYGPNTTYEVKGLNPATSYSFRVQAINSAGAGLYSPVATCLTPPSSPSSVVSIRASATATSVLLQWKEPHDNGSEIYAYNIDIGEKQLITISAVTEYTIEELSPETTYKARIQAMNGIGVGAFSSPVKFTTRALPPSPPKLECCGCSPTGIKLKWGEGRNTDLITYTLEMDREDGNYIEVYKGQAFTCKVNRLTELTSYDFRIYASNDAGSGPYSETYTFTTTKAPPPALRAPKVDQLTLTSCDVEWQSVRPMGEDRILYMLQLQCRDHEYRQVYKGSDTFFHLENLQCKTDYQVRVCAIRLSADTSELVGAFSPGAGFATLSPEPVKPVQAQVPESKLVEPKQLTDRQVAAIVVVGLVLVGVLFAFVAQQFISYTAGTPGRHDES